MRIRSSSESGRLVSNSSDKVDATRGIGSGEEEEREAAALNCTTSVDGLREAGLCADKDFLGPHVLIHS